MSPVGSQMRWKSTKSSHKCASIANLGSILLPLKFGGKKMVLVAEIFLRVTSAGTSHSKAPR